MFIYISYFIDFQNIILFLFIIIWLFNQRWKVFNYRIWFVLKLAIINKITSRLHWYGPFIPFIVNFPIWWRFILNCKYIQRFSIAARTNFALNKIAFILKGALYKNKFMITCSTMFIMHLSSFFGKLFTLFNSFFFVNT